MTADGIAIVKCLFTEIWRLFISWYLPGTNVTPMALFLFLAAAGIGLKFVSRFLDIGGGVSVSGAARSRNHLAWHNNHSKGKEGY